MAAAAGGGGVSSSDTSFVNIDLPLKQLTECTNFDSFKKALESLASSFQTLPCNASLQNRVKHIGTSLKQLLPQKIRSFFRQIHKLMYDLQEETYFRGTLEPCFDFYLKNIRNHADFAELYKKIPDFESFTHFIQNDKKGEICVFDTKIFDKFSLEDISEENSNELPLFLAIINTFKKFIEEYGSGKTTLIQITSNFVSKESIDVLRKASCEDIRVFGQFLHYFRIKFETQDHINWFLVSYLLKESIKKTNVLLIHSPFIFKIKLVLEQIKEEERTLNNLVSNELFQRYFKDLTDIRWIDSSSALYSMLHSVKKAFKDTYKNLKDIEPQQKKCFEKFVDSLNKEIPLSTHEITTLEKQHSSKQSMFIKSNLCETVEDFLKLPYANFMKDLKPRLSDLSSDNTVDDFGSALVGGVSRTIPRAKKAVDPSSLAAGGGGGGAAQVQEAVDPSSLAAGGGGGGGGGAAQVQEAVDTSFLDALKKSQEFVSRLSIDRRVKDATDEVHTAPLELLPIVFSTDYSYQDTFKSDSRYRSLIWVEKDGKKELHILEATIWQSQETSNLYHWNIKKAKTCSDLFALEALSDESYPTLKASRRDLSQQEQLIELKDVKYVIETGSRNVSFQSQDGTRYSALYLRKEAGS